MIKLYKDRYGRQITVRLFKFSIWPSVYFYPFFSARWLGLWVTADFNKITEMKVKP